MTGMVLVGNESTIVGHKTDICNIRYTLFDNKTEYCQEELINNSRILTQILAKESLPMSPTCHFSAHVLLVLEDCPTQQIAGGGCLGIETNFSSANTSWTV